MRIFVKVDLGLHFQGHLLQALDGQTQCDHFGENIIKIGGIVSETFNNFPVFLSDTFSTWKMETKLCSNLLCSCLTLFVDLEYLNHNQQAILEFVEQFSTN